MKKILERPAAGKNKKDLDKSTAVDYNMKMNFNFIFKVVKRMEGHGYKTRQKECILRCLEEHSAEAFSMDALCALMEKEGLSVGKTTVYRYVQKLVDAGKVRKFVEPGGKCATFQYIGAHAHCGEHLHLKCVSCGKFIHLECDLMRSVNEHILRDHGFCVDNAKSLLFGLCEDCMKKEAQTHASD